MRKIFPIIAVIMAAALFAACQATPMKPAVVQKDMQQMINKAKGGEEGSVKLTAIKTPKKFTTNLKNSKGNVIVTADAKITLPNTDKIPTAKVRKAKFTQDQADTIIKLLLKGQPFYEVNNDTSPIKQDIQKQLTKLYAMRAGQIPIDIEGPHTKNTQEDLSKLIAKVQNTLSHAMDEKNLPAATTQFQKRPDLGYDEAISGRTNINGENGILEIVNDDDWQNHVLYKRDNEQMAEVFQPLRDDLKYIALKTKPDQAQKTADDFIKSLGLDYLTLDSIQEASSASPLPEEKKIGLYAKVYKLEYVRQVKQTPVAHYDGGTASEGDKGESNGKYQAPWEYERMTFLINDGSIVQFEWYSPYTTPEIVTEDTELMSFDRISSVFNKMVLVKYAEYSDRSGKLAPYTVEYNVNDVRLNLLRVRSQNDNNSGLLIPVWDFIGTHWNRDNKTGKIISGTENMHQYILTINAVDGTIIDRQLGY